MNKKEVKLLIEFINLKNKAIKTGKDSNELMLLFEKLNRNLNISK
ncbi:Uncharacterised protein [Lysinibacillus sphaericus]|uniref:Uncharacterized protein n=1 Tax=Lysinibacillus sphaericus TaxID=1421 RepID=A0AAJ4ZSA7_LYSSH|nr:Uncharacterised protein [Lysinibacillus sphaericus]